ncbi:MAG TPA: hypothetical protein PKV13_04005 [Propionicimonas sp.]|nr:hypothetical protein [Propionicimonas sp.]HRA05765.1 hypothetical protein [Propionicimonas sp.]
MSTTVTEGQAQAILGDPRRFVASWIGLLVGLALVVGALAGVLWSMGVTLPTYAIQPDGSAVISERGLTEVVSADVWFVVTGALVGAGLGLVAWRWFHPLGWPTVLLALGAGLLAGVVCWQFGELIGPNHFADRLGTAQSGDLVPISLELRSISALAIWGLGAVTPVLLISSFGPDEEEGTAFWRRRPVDAELEDPGTVDERGVLTASEESTD